MNVRVSAISGVPIYRQIVEQVTHQVASGRLVEGDRLPSVRELAKAIPVNQNTVLKAYDLLERDGLIERRQGDGTFVASRGSPLSAAARLAIVREMLTDVAAKARVLEIGAETLHRLLDEQVAAVRPPLK